MWLVALFAFWIVPVLAYRRTRRSIPSHKYCITGMALGFVVSAASWGTYALFWVSGDFGLIALPLGAIGIVGLVLLMIHGTPGFLLATALGLRSGGVVHGIERVYIEVLNAIVWAIVYGSIGYLLDTANSWKLNRN